MKKKKNLFKELNKSNWRRPIKIGLGFLAVVIVLIVGIVIFRGKSINFKKAQTGILGNTMSAIHIQGPWNLCTFNNTSKNCTTKKTITISNVPYSGEYKIAMVVERGNDTANHECQSHEEFDIVTNGSSHAGRSPIEDPSECEAQGTVRTQNTRIALKKGTNTLTFKHHWAGKTHQNANDGRRNPIIDVESLQIKSITLVLSGRISTSLTVNNVCVGSPVKIIANTQTAEGIKVYSHRIKSGSGCTGKTIHLSEKTTYGNINWQGNIFTVNDTKHFTNVGTYTISYVSKSVGKYAGSFSSECVTKTFKVIPCNKPRSKKPKCNSQINGRKFKADVNNWPEINGVSPYRAPRPIDGYGISVNKDYFCSVGTLRANNSVVLGMPVFPTPGKYVSWTCNSGGKSVSCSATKEKKITIDFQCPYYTRFNSNPVGYIIDFGKYKDPNTGYRRRYIAGDMTSEVNNINEGQVDSIPAGHYKVRLYAFDGYNNNQWGNRANSYQNDERYRVVLSGIKTGYSTDLEDGTTTAFWDGIVNNTNNPIQLNSSVNKNNIYAEASSEDSVVPVCAWLVPMSIHSINGQNGSCSKEAKICSDGTKVGREGPNCEFAPCPTNTTNTNSDNSVNTGNHSSCGISSDLDSSSVGEDVKTLQRQLRKMGLYNLSIDGEYGWSTGRGVEKLQQQNNLPITGKVGSAERNILNRMICGAR